MSQFQIVSDIHIESGIDIKSIITPSKDNILILSGDLGRIENYDACYSNLKWLCENFKAVIFVPGNHEYYTTNPENTYATINKKIFSMKESLLNLIILLDDFIIIKDVLIFGSTFWSYCPREYFVSIPIYMEPHKLITSVTYNVMHINAQKELESCINYASENKLKMLVVTHHAPTFYQTLHPKYRNEDFTKNYMYCSHCDQYLINDVVKYWIYGHTGYNGTYNKLVSNQVNKNDYRPDFIITL